MSLISRQVTDFSMGFQMRASGERLLALSPVPTPIVIQIIDVIDLNDPTKRNSRTTATLTDIPPKGYLYTDFTGATLYLTKADQKVDLKKAGYKPGDPLAQVGFTWVTRDGQTAEWENISLEMRCYANSEPNPPPYEKVSEPIQSSKKQSVVTVPSCAVGKKGIDTIDLRLTQLNNGTSLMNIRKIQVTAYQ